MALDLLIAVPDTSRFRFDPSLLGTLATRVWPESEEFSAQGQVADIIDRYIYLPTGERRRCELALHRGGGAIGLTAPTELQAADVISWICAVGRPPADEEVLLLNWTPEMVRLSPDLTSADLLRRRA